MPRVTGISTFGEGLFQGETFTPETAVTVAPMGAREYWRAVCAPILKARKQILNHDLSDQDIASYVEAESGKSTSRVLVNLWFSGRREPYMSQFIALCSKLAVDPLGVLRGELLVKEESGRRTYQLGGNASSLQGKPVHTDKRKRLRKEYK